MCHCKNGCGSGKGMCNVSMIAKTLLIIGGVNWGLVGIGMLMGANWNVVEMILGSIPTLEAIVYILVGVAAVMQIFGCKCKKCMSGICTVCARSDNMPGKTEGQM